MYIFYFLSVTLGATSGILISLLTFYIIVIDCIFINCVHIHIIYNYCFMHLSFKSYRKKELQTKSTAFYIYLYSYLYQCFLLLPKTYITLPSLDYILMFNNPFYNLLDGIP